jgi:2-polyprenyl-3-methyl-5-hydroxy-6-metoxy-1,4-benzoquinol methylase
VSKCVPSQQDINGMDMSASVQGGRETPDIETSSDNYASRFAGAAGEYLLSVQEAGLLQLMQDGRPLRGRLVLDMGGGHAQLISPLLAQGCKVSVAGSNVQCAERVRLKHGDTVPFYEGNLVDMPIVDRAFDTVVSVRLISHMENWRGLVAEMCRVADKAIIIDYPTYASLNLLSLATFPLKKMIEKNTRTYRTFWDSEIRDSFAEHGFLPNCEFRQFTLPMALHRLCAKSSVVRTVEEGMRKSSITSKIGNPVLIRFDRKDA